MEKKKLIELLAAVFIAVIFVSSYAAFGNGGGGAAKNATTTVPGTIQVHGSAKATIVSYGKVLDVNVSCANASAVSGSLNDYLVELEKNGSIGNFYSPAGDEILLQTGNYTVADTYNALALRLGKDAECTEFTATQATVQLPSAITVTYSGGSPTKLPLPAGLRNYTRSITLTAGMNSIVEASVFALVTQNGTVFDNQIIVNLQGS